MHWQRNLAARMLNLACLLALLGCEQGQSKVPCPPKQQVADALRVVLPSFLSLGAVELEPLATGPESVKVNFKAAVAPKEELYELDRQVDGEPRVLLIKPVQAPGAKATLYG